MENWKWQRFVSIAKVVEFFYYLCLFFFLRINDGYIEVFGIYSSFHIAQLQVGLAEPFRIGRAQKVRIQTKKKFPIQIDGEPFEQSPSILEINLNNKILMLKKN